MPDLVYDVGFNTGQDTAYYLHKGYRVLAIEADPLLCAGGSERFSAEIGNGQLTLLHAAVAEEDGPVQFWVNRGFRGWSSLNEQLGSRVHGADPVRVSGVRFDGVLSRYGIPFYLKVDIEGSDDLCIRALESVWPDCPEFVSTEAVGKCLPLLWDLGYRRFQLREQLGAHDRDLSQCPWERWPPDSSGPFGPYLPDVWISYEEALAQYQEFLAGDPQKTFYDIHAAFH